MGSTGEASECAGPRGGSGLLPSPTCSLRSRARVLSQCDGHASAKRERVLAPWRTAFITQSTNSHREPAVCRASHWNQTKRDLWSLCSSMETLNRQISRYIYLITRSSGAKAVKEIKGGYRWDGSRRGGAAALDKVVKEAVPDEITFV